MRRKPMLTHVRPLRNEAERAFADAALRHGWIASKHGWPDFFIAREADASGEIRLVEVKPHRGRRLKSEQLAIMQALARYGVPCYRWSPGGGFERIEAR